MSLIKQIKKSIAKSSRRRPANYRRPRRLTMESLETRILAEYGVADPYGAPNQN